MFKSERILPVAFVSFKRRHKTLLWLDDWPDRDDNLRIRSKIPGAGWFEVAVVQPQEGRVSYKLNDAATDKKSTDALKREDQVDFTLFTSVAAMVAFLSDSAQSKFANYPPSLFRIISNRRLFLGTVPVSCCSKSEFRCDGLSALMSPGDEVVFEGERLFGGIAAGVTYYLVAVRRSDKENKEFFTVSKVMGGECMVLQPQEQDKTARRPPMSVRATKRSLLHFLETNDAWRLSFPATCIFHGSGGGDDLRAFLGQRPNFIATSAEADCGAFVAFEPVPALQEHE